LILILYCSAVFNDATLLLKDTSAFLHEATRDVFSSVSWKAMTKACNTQIRCCAESSSVTAMAFNLLDRCALMFCRSSGDKRGTN
jgi:hypothetical protein